MAEDRLLPLKKAKKYRVHRKDLDPRGWEVVTADGKTIGKVDDLVVDLRAGHARYLSVKIDKKVVDVDRTVLVLVPVEPVRLVEDNKRAFVEGVNSREFSALPEYGNEPLTHEQEQFVRERFPSGPSGAAPAEDRERATEPAAPPPPPPREPEANQPAAPPPEPTREAPPPPPPTSPEPPARDEQPPPRRTDDV